jgi:serine O-acetyltransferase
MAGMGHTFTEAIRADFAVNVRAFDRATLLVFRLNQAAVQSRFRRVLRPAAKVLDLLWIQSVIGAEIPGSLDCGPGLRLPHGGRGVILNANSRIGSGVTIYHRVTLGVSGDDPRNVPNVDDGAYLGTGAVLVGGVTVGRNAKVGAGAVVTKDVPADQVAVGVPAKILTARQQFSS